MHQYKITKEFDISSSGLKVDADESAQLTTQISKISDDIQEPKLVVQISDVSSDISQDIPMATVEKIQYNFEALPTENSEWPELSPNTKLDEVV